MDLGPHGAPRLLDVIEFGVTSPSPKPYQPEDWVLARTPWRLIRRGLDESGRALLRKSLARDPLLFGTKLNHVSPGEPRSSSLALILLEDFEWQLREPSQPGATRRQARVNFHRDRINYDLPLTDDDYEHRLQSLPTGFHAISNGATPELKSPVLATVSIGEPYEKTGYCYLLVAAIIPMERR